MMKREKRGRNYARKLADGIQYLTTVYDSETLFWECLPDVWHSDLPGLKF